MIVRPVQIVLGFIGIGFIFGCVFHPRMEKLIAAKWMPKDQVDVIKRTITEEGYEIQGKENFYWEGAIGTNYAKQIAINQNKTDIQIILSFKEIDSTKGFYRNLGLTVLNKEYPRHPKVKAEVDRMEGLLYQKLLEVTNPEYVKRGTK